MEEIIHVPLVCTVGCFDGLHRGHEFFIKDMRACAAQLRAFTAVFTFDPPPVFFFNSFQENYQIEDKRAQTILFKQNSVDYLFFLKFDLFLAEQEWASFLNFLLRNFQVHAFFFGYDFRFGSGRKGNVSEARVFLGQRNIPCYVVSCLNDSFLPISSSRIRSLIRKGDMHGAYSLLGRFWCAEGEVVYGRKEARKLGFPTANVHLNVFRIHPPEGIYGSYVEVDKKIYRSLLYLSYRTSMNRDAEQRFFLVESHILNYSKDLYGKRIKIFPLFFIRNVMSFPTRDAIIKSIERDREDLLNRFSCEKGDFCEWFNKQQRVSA